MNNYTNPQLSVLGSVSDLTRAFGTSGQTDIGFIPGRPGRPGRQIPIPGGGSQDGVLVPCGPGTGRAC